MKAIIFNFLLFIFFLLCILFSNFFISLLSFLSDEKINFLFFYVAQFHLNFFLFLLFFFIYYFFSLNFTKKINFFVYSLYAYNFFSFFNVKQFFWYLQLQLTFLFNFLRFELINNFFFFFIFDFFKGLSLYFWKPLFKRSSYFGYFRSTRTQWLN